MSSEVKDLIRHLTKLKISINTLTSVIDLNKTEDYPATTWFNLSTEVDKEKYDNLSNTFREWKNALPAIERGVDSASRTFLALIQIVTGEANLQSNVQKCNEKDLKELSQNQADLELIRQKRLKGNSSKELFQQGSLSSSESLGTRMAFDHLTSLKTIKNKYDFDFGTSFVTHPM